MFNSFMASLFGRKMQGVVSNITKGEVYYAVTDEVLVIPEDLISKNNTVVYQYEAQSFQKEQLTVANEKIKKGLLLIQQDVDKDFSRSQYQSLSRQTDSKPEKTVLSLPAKTDEKPQQKEEKIALSLAEKKDEEPDYKVGKIKLSQAQDKWLSFSEEKVEQTDSKVEKSAKSSPKQKAEKAEKKVEKTTRSVPQPKIEEPEPNFKKKTEVKNIESEEVSNVAKMSKKSKVFTSDRQVYVGPGQYKREGLCINEKGKKFFTLWYRSRMGEKDIMLMKNVQISREQEIRQCVWINNNSVVCTQVAREPKSIRFAPHNSQYRNYPPTRICTQCSQSAKCKKDCIEAFEYGGFVML